MELFVLNRQLFWLPVLHTGYVWPSVVCVLTMDYAWEIVLTHCPQVKGVVQEGSGTHDNPSMQEFQKNMQVLWLFFFCMLTSV